MAAGPTFLPKNLYGNNRQSLVKYDTERYAKNRAGHALYMECDAENSGADKKEG